MEDILIKCAVCFTIVNAIGVFSTLFAHIKLVEHWKNVASNHEVQRERGLIELEILSSPEEIERRELVIGNILAAERGVASRRYKLEMSKQLEIENNYIKQAENSKFMSGFEANK